MNQIKHPQIVFNTFSPDAAASLFYGQGMKSLANITFSDFDHYDQYDVAFFMTYPKDLEELKRAKTINPNLKTAILDPRGSQVEPFLPWTDLLIVDSLEMKDFFAKYGKPIYTYYEYPDVPLVTKTHKDKEKIIIGYHGNKVHLTAMYPEITSALEKLGNRYPIEFHAVYNVAHLGKWDIGVPKNIEVKHIQWSMEAYEKHLASVDIGLAPACMPVKASTRRKSIVSRFFLDNRDDYVIKFKMPSNPGRVIVFAKLGVPVVADFLPSNIQFIRDGENGLLAKSAGGWYRALEQLIVSAPLRQKLSDNMQETYRHYFDYQVQNNKLETWLAQGFDEGPATIEKVLPKHKFIEDLKFQNAFLYESCMRLKRKIL